LTRRPTLLVAAAAAAALAAAGCGGGGGSTSTTPSSAPAAAATTPASTSGAGTKLNLSADPSALRFNKKVLSAKSGSVTITMSNPSSLSHAIAVEGNGVDQKGQAVTKGGTSNITLNLKPGKYTFYCPVDGHRAAGMMGTLTVQ
jgi:plastocyanin